MAPDRPGAEDVAGAGALRRVLVVDDMSEVLQIFRAAARRVPNLVLETETDVGRAIGRLQEARFDVVVSDHRVRGGWGARVLEEAQRVQPAARRILVSAHWSLVARDPSVGRAQPHEFLSKPLQADAFERILGVASRERTRLFGAQRGS